MQYAAEDHMRLAYSQANKLRSKFPSEDFDELEADALFGLVMATKTPEKAKGDWALYASMMAKSYALNGIRTRRREGAARPVYSPAVLTDEMQEVLVDSDAIPGEALVSAASVKALVRSASGQSTQTERVLGALYDGWSVADIATDLGVTKPRIHQMVKAARLRLERNST